MASMSSVRRSFSTFESINSIATKYFKPSSPGFSLGVLKDDAVILCKGYGLADVEKNVPITARTRFAIGSVTKQFTAVSIMILVERNLLSLTEPLSKFFPEFPNSSNITLLNLLNHTSGLHSYPFIEERPFSKIHGVYPEIYGAVPPEDIKNALITDPIDFEPNTKFEYSNTNYLALGMIVSKVSKKSFSEFLQTEIFKPLGMIDSGTGLDAQTSKDPNHEMVAVSYSEGIPQKAHSLDLFLGTGDVISSASDMLKYCSALLNERIISKNSIDLLWTSGRLPNGIETGYGMGFGTVNSGRRCVTHTGYAPTCGGLCQLSIYPDNNVSVVVLSNNGEFAEGAVLTPQILDELFPPPVLESDEETKALVMKLYKCFIKGELNKDLMSPELIEKLTPALMEPAKATFNALGLPKDLSLRIKEDAPDGTSTLNYAATYDSMMLSIRLSINKDQKVTSYRLLPYV